MIQEPTKVLVELKPSKIHQGGVGVFAVCAIRMGQRICDGVRDEDYAGLIPWSNFEGYDHDVRKKISDFCITTPNGFIVPAGFDFNNLTVMWFLNHSCDGNCGFNVDGDMVAVKQIESGKELTYDYGLAESDPNFVMGCTCTAPSCRKAINGNDWRNEDFQAKKRSHMLPRLRLPSLRARTK